MEGYCSAYVYWYLKRFYGLMGDNDKRSPVGEGEIAKNGYIMAHYAQYATGTTRIKAVTNNTGICATAYINETGNEVTVVLLNFTGATQCIEIPLAGMKQKVCVLPVRCGSFPHSVRDWHHKWLWQTHRT